MSGENIEELKDELSTIKDDLKELKKDTDRSITIRKKEAKELLDQAKETEKKLRDEIAKINEALKKDKKSVDKKTKKVKEEAEFYLEDDIMEEIQNLHDDIKKLKRKKSFWKSGFGKAIKGTAIGAAVLAGLFFISGGKIKVVTEDSKDDKKDKDNTEKTDNTNGIDIITESKDELL